MKPSELLSAWLSAHLSPSSFGWLQEKAAQIASGAPERTVGPAFSTALRHAGKDPLALDPAALKSASAAVEGWNPSDWTLDQAARILLLLALPKGEASARMLTRMHQTSDVGESVALQKALPLLPEPEACLPWAREGVRSNIKLVFDALVLRNPYPALHFDDIGWNQIVAKSFFMDSPLEEIWGLDRRNNTALARMLTDLAFERWAAGRTIAPMVWRCVGPVADTVPNGRAFEALAKALKDSDPAHRRAAALGLAACLIKGPNGEAVGLAPEAARLLASDSDLAAAVKSGSLTWETLNA